MALSLLVAVTAAACVDAATLRGEVLNISHLSTDVGPAAPSAGPKEAMLAYQSESKKVQTAISDLDYQNARCALAASAKLLFYPYQTWTHYIFPAAKSRGHNPFWQLHDFMSGRVNVVPCQVEGLQITSLTQPIRSPSTQPPGVTWLGATYVAGPLGFWAYDSAGNSMCRLCLFQSEADITKDACTHTIERLAGKGEFDCSYELDNHLAEYNIAYVGHDLPEHWSGWWAWAAYLGMIALICCCICCAQLVQK